MSGKIRIISGSDEFAVRERLKNVAAEWAGGPPGDNPDWEIIRGDDSSKSAADVLFECTASLSTPPFLSAEKTVCLINFSGFGELETPENSAAFARLLEVLKPGLPDNIHFLAGGVGLDGRRTAAKTLKALPGAALETMNLPDPKRRDARDAMRLKLEEYASGHGRRLTPDAAELMLAAVGTDTGQLYGELDKLFTWQGEDASPLTAADMREVLSAVGEAPGWEFAEALRSGSSRDAFKVLHRLLRQQKLPSSGGSELSLLYTAAGVFEDVLRTRAEMKLLKMPEYFNANYFSGMSEAEKADLPDCSLLHMHPFRAFKLCEAARKFSGTRLSEIFRTLLETNLALVTGSQPPVSALEKMVRNICGG